MTDGFASELYSNNFLPNLTMIVARSVAKRIVMYFLSIQKIEFIN